LRQHRLQAAKDATAVARSQVADNERGIAFQVAQLFINVQLAQSTLDLARQDLKSYQETVDISEKKSKSGGISENDFLKIKLRDLQFEQDVQQAELAKTQALSDLRQLLGYESVPADYRVAGVFDYQQLKLTLTDLQAKALENHGISAITFSVQIPLAIFDRNQGEIARTHFAITQAQHQQAAARGWRNTFGLAILKCRRRIATSANTPTGEVPRACSIFWTRSEAIEPRNSPGAGRSPLT